MKPLRTLLLGKDYTYIVQLLEPHLKRFMKKEKKNCSVSRLALDT
jgi:hypothetical protein